MIKIDKSVFNAEELQSFEELLAKATVDEAEVTQPTGNEPAANNPEQGDTNNPTQEGQVMVDTQKSEVSPEIKAALERFSALEKSIEMKECLEIAKKYAPLGEKEDELAKTLYDMKKSNEANFNAYIGVLDKSLGLVEKSGVFAEIGKSTSGTGSVTDKIEAAASEIQKADPTISRYEAVAKAWENHPELIAEYDKEYNA